jgi:hypothetical protein
LARNSLDSPGVESMARLHYQFSVPHAANHSREAARPLRGRSAVVRLLAAGWMVAFAALSVGLPLLDAPQEHASAVVVHWEDAGATGCAQEHAPECIVCQVVTGTRSVAAIRPSLVLAMADVDVAVPETRVGVLATIARAIPSTRAPPVV